MKTVNLKKFSNQSTPAHQGFIFSPEQRLTVGKLIKFLPEAEQWVVYMRFWDSWPMYKIANFFEISVVDAERLLEQALRRLRVHCLNSPVFQSHAKPNHALAVAA